MKMKRGLVHVYTGDGKGKTTAALGLALRAVGTGLKVVVVQFLKGRDTGELRSLARLGIPVMRSGVRKFVPDMTPEERAACRAEQHACFDEAKRTAGACDLLILDEIFGAVSTGMIGAEELETFVREKPEGTELVLTGRDAPPAIVGLADYVSDIRGVKHPYDRGIPARRGIEF